MHFKIFLEISRPPVLMSARPSFNVPESLIPRDFGNMLIFNLGRVFTRLRHSEAFMFVSRVVLEHLCLFLELFCSIYVCFQSCSVAFMFVSRVVL